MSAAAELPIPEPRTGVRVHAPRRGMPNPQVYVDSDAGQVVLDITNPAGARVELLLRPDEAERLADVIARHAKEGRY